MDLPTYEENPEILFLVILKILLSGQIALNPLLSMVTLFRQVSTVFQTEWLPSPLFLDQLWFYCLIFVLTFLFLYLN